MAEEFANKLNTKVQGYANKVNEMLAAELQKAGLTKDALSIELAFSEAENKGRLTLTAKVNPEGLDETPATQLATLAEQHINKNSKFSVVTSEETNALNKELGVSTPLLNDEKAFEQIKTAVQKEIKKAALALSNDAIPALANTKLDTAETPVTKPAATNAETLEQLADEITNKVRADLSERKPHGSVNMMKGEENSGLNSSFNLKIALKDITPAAEETPTTEKKSDDTTSDLEGEEPKAEPIKKKVKVRFYVNSGAVDLTGAIESRYSSAPKDVIQYIDTIQNQLTAGLFGEDEKAYKNHQQKPGQSFTFRHEIEVSVNEDTEAALTQAVATKMNLNVKAIGETLAAIEKGDIENEHAQASHSHVFEDDGNFDDLGDFWEEDDDTPPKDKPGNVSPEEIKESTARRSERETGNGPGNKK